MQLKIYKTWLQQYTCFLFSITVNNGGGHPIVINPLIVNGGKGHQIGIHALRINAT